MPSQANERRRAPQVLVAVEALARVTAALVIALDPCAMVQYKFDGIDFVLRSMLVSLGLFILSN